jgi:transposase
MRLGMFTVPAPLPDDPATLQRLLGEAPAEIERLTLRMAGLERARFGRRSEQLSVDTLQQESEELEQSLAEQSAKLNAAAAALDKRTPEPPARTEPPKRNRVALPAHLPRVEIVIDVEDKSCPCCLLRQAAARHRRGPRGDAGLRPGPVACPCDPSAAPAGGWRHCTNCS